ncbi:glycosyl hydrolase [Paenibacillus sp. CAA11]|uniref:glycosyl hydrolase family 18 protein n=1 Tax=Paenibacillus sp. CAA11 TaxID=1532905 RepID=UPI000D3ABD8D|nr:glycosyl hydrolase family 18 protein [Paenibacillus sp. CAA11]AWB45955.1 glycosyl hydrolase [Paenibacillus sp. CAA11]
MSRRSMYRTRKKRRTGRWLLLLLLMGAAYAVYYWFVPNHAHVDPDWKGRAKPIFAKGLVMDYSAAGTGDKLLIPLPVIQKEIDSNVRYEEDSASIVMATPDKLVRLKVNQAYGEMNNHKLSLTSSPSVASGVPYVPAKLIEQLYGVQFKEDSASGVVHIYKPGERIERAQVANNKEGTAPLRQEASIHSPIYADVPSGANLRLLRAEGEWYYAQTDGGYTGYIRQKEVVPQQEATIPEVKKAVSPAEKQWKNKRVNLTWEAVYQVPASPSRIGRLPGVNVVSPTWFQLKDTKGNVKNKADRAYVTWAHLQGMQVWGLFSNSFDADLTSEAMAAYDRRLNAINQMVKYAKQYDLDGINIDFESVHTKDGDNVTQFLREMRPLAHAAGLTLSIDVTPKSNSELWSKFLNRKELGSIVDFMALMAYDEHWAASPQAGSVASLPWTEAAVTKILEEDEVPPAKLILGVPLYTRVWTEKTENGETKVSSKAIGMDKAEEIIKQLKLEKSTPDNTGQNYVQYQEDGALKRIWLEDVDSLEQRVDLVHRLNLGGIGSWNRGFASKEAWEVLSKVNE